MPQYLRSNFARGSLFSLLTDVATQLTVSIGHTLPTSAGQMVLVIWNMSVYQNPADDPDTEIVIATYSGTPNVYNVTRGQEDTLAVAHSAGSEVALHYTAGVSEADFSVVGSYLVDESLAGEGKILKISSGALKYFSIVDDPACIAATKVAGVDTNGMLSSVVVGTGLVLAGGILSCSITQYTDADARGVFSTTATGLTYSSASGVLSLTAGYMIPTTTQASNWDSAYSSSHSAATVGGDPLSILGQQISFNYNTTNFKITANQLNTIQDINTSASVQFGKLALGVAVGATYEFEIQSSTASMFRGHYDGGSTFFTVMSSSDTASSAPFFILARTRGTYSVPTNIADGDTIGHLQFTGYSEGSTRNAARISAFADGEWGTGGDTTDNPSRMLFYTTPNGSGTQTERVRIDSSGNVGINYTAGTHKLSVNGTTAFGDGGTTNYSSFGSTGNLVFNGSSKVTGYKQSVTTKTTAYTATNTDDVIVCNSTTAFTITLPVASGSGKVYNIKNINTGAITVDGDSSDTIDGSITIVLGQWDSVTIVDYAANAWAIL